MQYLKKNELIQECRYSCINVSGTETNVDLVRKINQHRLLLEYGDSIPWSVGYRNNMESPMLSKNFKDLKLKQQQDILSNSSSEWISEIKYNGCRCIMTYEPDYGFRFFGRHVSKDTYLSEEFTDKILLIKDGFIRKGTDYKKSFPKKFVLDCEILLPQDTLYWSGGQNPVSRLLEATDIELCQDYQRIYPLSFVVFDLLFYDNVGFIDSPLKVRKPVQEKLVNKLNKYGLPYFNSRIFHNNFVNVFDTIVRLDLHIYEGLVFKNLNECYFPNTKRQANVQVKLKKNLYSVSILSEILQSCF